MSLFFSLGRMACFFIVFMVLCLVVIGPAFCLDEQVADKDKRVSFEFREQSMAEVAGLISEQLNYKVLMDDELTSVPVSGKFTNVTLDDFFSRRIFRGKNIAILFDDDEHVVMISSLGKKSRMTEYDRTDYKGLSTGLSKTDPLDMEVQPGIKRRDVVAYVSEIDPMDHEVQPGVKRRNVELYVNDIDPMELEVQPGVRRRDVVPPPPPIDPNEVEIQPGIKRVDVAKVTDIIDPLDMLIQPGIKRRDVLQYNFQ